MAWPNVYGLDVGRLTGQGDTPRRPAVLLVHDAFQANAHLTPLHNQLVNSNLQTLTPQLPSSNFTYQANAVELDVQTLVEVAKPALRTGLDMIVVMFGYGGIPGSITADRLNDWSLDTPRAGHVIKLVFVSAMVLEENECFVNVLRMEPDAYDFANGMVTMKPSERQLTFEPCPPQLVAVAVARLRPHNVECMTTRIPIPGWQNIPSLYIICELDNVWSPENQARLAARLQAGNRQTSIGRLRSGHAPFLTNTAQMVALIVRLADNP